MPNRIIWLGLQLDTVPATGVRSSANLDRVATRRHSVIRPMALDTHDLVAGAQLFRTDHDLRIHTDTMLSLDAHKAATSSAGLLTAGPPQQWREMGVHQS